MIRHTLFSGKKQVPDGMHKKIYLLYTCGF